MLLLRVNVLIKVTVVFAFNLASCRRKSVPLVSWLRPPVWAPCHCKRMEERWGAFLCSSRYRSSSSLVLLVAAGRETEWEKESHLGLCLAHRQRRDYMPPLWSLWRTNTICCCVWRNTCTQHSHPPQFIHTHTHTQRLKMEKHTK